MINLSEISWEVGRWVWSSNLRFLNWTDSSQETLTPFYKDDLSLNQSQVDEKYSDFLFPDVKGWTFFGPNVNGAIQKDLKRTKVEENS